MRTGAKMPSERTVGSCYYQVMSAINSKSESFSISISAAGVTLSDRVVPISFSNQQSIQQSARAAFSQNVVGSLVFPRLNLPRQQCLGLHLPKMASVLVSQPNSNQLSRSPTKHCIAYCLQHSYFTFLSSRGCPALAEL